MVRSIARRNLSPQKHVFEKRFGFCASGVVLIKPRIPRKNQLFKVFTATAALILIAGCGTPAKYDFVKDGASSFDKQNAVAECSYQIKLNKIPAAEQRNLLTLCMQGKGYRYRQIN